MKRILILSALILFVSCKVEKTGKDTYKVVAPTPEAKAATQKAVDKARDATHDASVAIAKKTETAPTTETTSTSKTETTVTTTTHKQH